MASTPDCLSSKRKPFDKSKGIIMFSPDLVFILIHKFFFLGRGAFVFCYAFPLVFFYLFPPCNMEGTKSKEIVVGIA